MADTHAKHDYHIIDPSPWPFLASAGAFIMMIGLVGFMRYAAGGQFVMFGVDLAGPWIFYLGLALVLYVMYAWWSRWPATTPRWCSCTCATA